MSTSTPAEPASAIDPAGRSQSRAGSAGVTGPADEESRPARVCGFARPHRSLRGRHHRVDHRRWNSARGEPDQHHRLRRPRLGSLARRPVRRHLQPPQRADSYRCQLGHCRGRLPARRRTDHATTQPHGPLAHSGTRPPPTIRRDHDQQEHRQGEGSREGSCRRANRRSTPEERRTRRPGHKLREEHRRQGRRHPHRPQQNQALEARMREPTQLRLGR
jgi:hypothetical protein